MDAGTGRFLGEWTIRSQPVRIYEFRYPCSERYGVRVDYRAKRSDRSYKVFGFLSIHVPSVSLLPGEFIVKSFDQMKNHWQELSWFPEFEDTLKRYTFREGWAKTAHQCPIWRFTSHDCMADGEPGPCKDEGGLVPHTGTVEATYMEIKDLVKGRPSEEDLAQLLIGMKTQDAIIIRDAVALEAQATKP